MKNNNLVYRTLNTNKTESEINLVVKTYNVLNKQDYFIHEEGKKDFRISL